MGEEIKTLKRSRTGHKIYATKVVKETELMLKSRELSIEDLQEFEDQLITNQKILNEKLGVLKDLNERISLLIEKDEDLEIYIPESSDFQRYVLKSSVSISSWLKRNSVDNASTITAVDTSSALKSKSTSAKLPKLSLKKLSGDPLSFQSFWDSFESAVDKNASLDDITKFNYLKNLLEVKACLALQGLVLTSENYKTAVNLLKERFGDAQVVITAHMDALLNISPTKTNAVNELRNIYDFFEIHTRSLQILHVEAHS